MRYDVPAFYHAPREHCSGGPTAGQVSHTAASHRDDMSLDVADD
jgi:hypothetical protein